MGKRQSPKSRCKLHFDWLLISSEGCFVWFLFWVNELNQSHWSCGSKPSVLCFCLSGDQRDSIRTSLTLSRGQSSVRAEGFTTILSHAKISASINKTEELFLQSAAHFARITLFINIEGGHQPPCDNLNVWSELICLFLFSVCELNLLNILVDSLVSYYYCNSFINIIATFIVIYFWNFAFLNLF